jgi:hypothetical protein
MRGNLQQDPDAYREIADNLLRHGEFALGKPSGTGPEEAITPTAYRPPLYPVVLSNLPTREGKQVSLAKVAALHLALGVATVWLTWLTARWVGQATAGRAGPPAAGVKNGGPALASTSSSHRTIAGLVVACDPILLNQQTLVMTETLTAFLAILSLWCLARFDAARSWFNAALAGGAIGLAVLCRPTFLPWLGLVGVGMLLVRGRNSEFRMQNSERQLQRSLGDIRWRFVNFAGLAVAAAAVVSPWPIRNYRVFGEPIVTSTHGGYTFLLGNNFYFYRWLKEPGVESVWKARELEQNINVRVPSIAEGTKVFLLHNEPTMDRRLYREASQWIQRDPVMFTEACAYRVLQLWLPLPHKLTVDESMGRRLLRYATCVWYCGVYVLAAIGIWRLRWKLLAPPWIWGVLLCFTFTAVHTFYWTNLRMRAPLMPFVALVAAAGVAKMTEIRSDGEKE